jgi:hypothetical protein
MEEPQMDWIERWFGFSPDGGDGSFEWLIVCVAIVVGVTALTIAVVPRARPMLSQLLSSGVGRDRRGR